MPHRTLPTDHELDLVARHETIGLPTLSIYRIAVDRIAAKSSGDVPALSEILAHFEAGSAAAAFSDESIGADVWLMTLYRSRPKDGVQRLYEHPLKLSFEGVIDEAEEENLPIPTALALSQAERILWALDTTWQRSVEIYPTPDGEVCLDFSLGAGSSVLVLCGSDGTAMCLVNFNGDQHVKQYDNALVLPDAFLRESLDSLPRSSQ